MSLFDRVMREAANDGSFKSCGGALFTTDRSRGGKRNKMSGGNFVGKNKRYPTGRCWASTAGSMSQAHQRGVLKKKTSADAPSEVCPTAKKGCPEKRDHGEGGKTPKASPSSRDHAGTSEWPFFHSRKKPKWDADWTKLRGAGHKKGSSGVSKQKDEPKRKTFAGTKGHHKAKAKDLKKELAGHKGAAASTAKLGQAGGDMSKVQATAKSIAKHAKKAGQAATRGSKRKRRKGGKLPELKSGLKGRHKQKVPSASGKPAN